MNPGLFSFQNLQQGLSLPLEQGMGIGPTSPETSVLGGDGTSFLKSLLDVTSQKDKGLIKEALFPDTGEFLAKELTGAESGLNTLVGYPGNKPGVFSEKRDLVAALLGSNATASRIRSDKTSEMVSLRIGNDKTTEFGTVTEDTTGNGRQANDGLDLGEGKHEGKLLEVKTGTTKPGGDGCAVARIEVEGKGLLNQMMHREGRHVATMKPKSDEPAVVQKGVSWSNGPSGETVDCKETGQNEKWIPGARNNVDKTGEFENTKAFGATRVLFGDETAEGRQKLISWEDRLLKGMGEPRGNDLGRREATIENATRTAIRGTQRETGDSGPKDLTPGVGVEVSSFGRARTEAGITVAHNEHLPKPTIDHTSAERKPLTFFNTQGPEQIDGTGSDNKNSDLMFSNSQTHAKSFDAILSMNESGVSERSFSREIVSQVVEKAALHFKAGENEVRITLKPETLGHLKMNIATENQQVMVRIVAEVPMAKAMIESNLGLLKSALQSHGLEIDSFDVSLASDSNHNGDRFGRPSLVEVSEDSAGDGDDAASEEETDTRPMSVRKTDETGIVDFFA